MAANFLGLFFLIIGTAGISNVLSLKEFFHRNKRSFLENWPADSFDLRSFRGRSEALCRYKYGPFACRNIVYDLPHFRLETDHNKKNYPLWKNQFFRHGFAQGQPFENPLYEYNDFYDPYESSEESTISENSYISDDSFKRQVNNEQKISDYIRPSAPLSSPGNPTQTNSYSKSNTHVTSSSGINFVPDSYVTRKKLSNFKFLQESNKDSRATDTTSNSEISQIIYRTPVERQQKSSFFTNIENVDLMEVKNTSPTLENSSEGDTMESSMNNKDIESTSEYFTNIFRKNEGTDRSFTDKTEDRIDGLTFPITSYQTTPETKGFYPKKISSLQEHLNKPLEEDLRTESRPIQGYTENYSIINGEATALGDKSSSSDGTGLIKNHVSNMLSNFGRRSTAFQVPFSFTTREEYLNNRSNSPNGIQPISNKESNLDPTASQSSSSITTDDENSLKSSSSEGIYSVSTTQSLDTESGTSQSSFTMTYDGTASQSRLSSSLETQSTTAEILEIESTTENSISSNKVTSIPFTDKVETDSRKETFSTESPSSKIHFTSQAITKDHIIEISSIRTARIVVTSVFLVIALTALTVLAVFMFRLRRREVEYDQLMLIT